MFKEYLNKKGKEKKFVKKDFSNKKLVLHHIDENKENNDISNLALVTKKAHDRVSNLYWWYTNYSLLAFIFNLLIAFCGVVFFVTREIIYLFGLLFFSGLIIVVPIIVFPTPNGPKWLLVEFTRNEFSFDLRKYFKKDTKEKTGYLKHRLHKLYQYKP